MLHRVGGRVQGPVDSVATDAAGRFAFQLVPDTASLYILSASAGGIEYFSAPLRPTAGQPDSAVVIEVADTSSTAPVELASRHLVVSRPGESGARQVLDLLVLRNGGWRTRVARDSLSPTFRVPLPAGAAGVGAAEGDFSPEAVGAQGDTLLLAAPIAPGEKQLMVQYELPAATNRVTLPVQDSIAELDVMLEEPGARVSGGALVPADSQMIDGRSFRRWSGAAAPGQRILLAFPGAAGAPRWVLPALVGAAGAALAFAALRLRRRGLQPAAAPVGPGTAAAPGLRAAGLLDEIAALDATYAGREGQVPAGEWARYRADRARLKAALEAALAERGSST